jgi:hypothetical protein
MTEQIFEVFWEGPYDWNGRGDPDALSAVHENCVLYMICGTHVLYGRNVPLYIGRTERRLRERLIEHDRDWIKYETDTVKIHAGYARRFISWEGWPQNWTNHAENPPLPTKTVADIEKILIYSHFFAYNERAKKLNSPEVRNVRLFNTGRHSTLLPEVSSLFYHGT